MVPVLAKGASLKLHAPTSGPGRVQLAWQRGPAIEPDLVEGAPVGPNRLCIYDQDADGYRLVHAASATGGAWSASGLGWRFGNRAATDGISKVAIKPSGPFRSRVDVRSVDPDLAGLLPLRKRRSVVAQLHAGGGCWGASFLTATRSDAGRFAGYAAIPSLVDTNGNGVREWMIVGDSLSNFPGSCAYPTQFALRHPGITVSNEAIFGSHAVNWVAHGTVPPLLVAHEPDAVLIALGTNDLAFRSADQIVADLRALHDQVVGHTLPNGLHPVAYVATIARLYLHPREFDEKVDAVNAALRAWLPASRVVDFDSWMPAEWDPDLMLWSSDGVHLGCVAHTRRAEVLDVVAGN